MLPDAVMAHMTHFLERTAAAIAAHVDTTGAACNGTAVDKRGFSKDSTASADTAGQGSLSMVGAGVHGAHELTQPQTMGAAGAGEQVLGSSWAAAADAAAAAAITAAADAAAAYTAAADAAACMAPVTAASTGAAGLAGGTGLGTVAKRHVEAAERLRLVYRHAQLWLRRRNSFELLRLMLRL